MRQQLRYLLALSFGSGLVVLASAASAGAQNVVDGTGDPDIDVPAVQAAVDLGGEVILRGHFSFDRDPTIALPPGFEQLPGAMVLISSAVAISGARDEHGDEGEVTTIEAGTIPFYVEAPGASVTIRGLRFVRWNNSAILVYAASGLVIESCKIEGWAENPGIGAGIRIDTSGSTAGPGHPENVSGTLLIVNNHIDMAGGTADDNTLGIIIWYVGVPGAEVEAYVAGNAIRNFHERAINIRGVGGRTYIEGNVIATGTVPGGIANLHPIFVTGPSSSYSHLIAHNSIHVEWDTGSAAGISVRDGLGPGGIAHVIVVDNDINMDAPEGTVFDDRSAGIEIDGDCHDNVVLNNRITGHARAALSVGTPIVGGPPANNAFILNRLHGFQPTLADIFVADGVMNTLIVGQGTVEDHGVGTIVVRVP